jgi:hypothetical protein
MKYFDCSFIFFIFVLNQSKDHLMRTNTFKKENIKENKKEEVDKIII